MAIEGSASAEIDAPIARVYEVAADVENSPKWQTDFKRVEVIERDAEGRQTLVEVGIDAKVRELAAKMRFTYDEPNGLSWRQEEGDLKSIEGGWVFEDLGGERTRATYSSTVDLGRMLGMVIRGPIVDLLRRQMITSMPGKLKGYVET